MVSSLVTDVEIAAAALDDNANEEGAKRT